jgi:hypothetical protein
MYRLFVLAAAMLLVSMFVFVGVCSQSILYEYSVLAGLRSVTVYRNGNYLFLAAWNSSAAPFGLLVYNLNTSSSGVVMVCSDAGFIVSGDRVYAICGKDLYRDDGVKIYSFYVMPYFTFFDVYSNRLIAAVNFGFGSELFVVDVNARTASSYSFVNWFIYGFGSNRNYYYTIQFNGASWWVVAYSRDFSRVVRNVSIPVPLAANTGLARYSAFGVNDLAVVVLFNGYTVVYDVNLNVVKNVSMSFVRVESTVYHFYGYTSDGRVYVISPTGYVYDVGVNGLTYNSMVGSYLYRSDLGVVYNDSGKLYIVRSPNDVAITTVTSTVTAALPVYYTRTRTVTTTMYAFAPETPVAVVIFFALLIIVAAVFFILRKR